MILSLLFTVFVILPTLILFAILCSTERKDGGR